MIRKIILAVIAVLLLAAIGFVLWVASYPELSKIKTVGDLPRNQSQYLTMRDGVKICVDVYRPDDGVRRKDRHFNLSKNEQGLLSPFLSFEQRKSSFWRLHHLLDLFLYILPLSIFLLPPCAFNFSHQLIDFAWFCQIIVCPQLNCFQSRINGSVTGENQRFRE